MTQVPEHRVPGDESRRDARYWLLIWNNAEHRLVAQVFTDTAPLLAGKAVVEIVKLAIAGRSKNCTMITNCGEIAEAISEKDRLYNQVQYRENYVVIGQDSPEIADCVRSLNL